MVRTVKEDNWACARTTRRVDPVPDVAGDRNGYGRLQILMATFSGCSRGVTVPGRLGSAGACTFRKEKDGGKQNSRTAREEDEVLTVATDQKVFCPLCADAAAAIMLCFFSI